MPLQIPTLTTIRSNIEADINGRLKGADSRLPRNVLAVISFALAAVCWGVYVFQAKVARQRLPDTMDDDQLDRFGGLFGVTRTQAGFAAGTTTATGTDGSVIPSGTALQTQDNTEYTTQADATIAGGSVVVAVRASVAGADGNQAVGTTLSFIAPVLGVRMATTVVAITGGIDQESDDAYRGRIIDHLQSPPQGGTLNDYAKWAREIAGVTRAWARANYMGAGTVGVFFVFDGRDAIFPTADDVTTMQAWLDSKKPSTDTVYAVAPVPLPVDHTIALNPSSETLQAAVKAELADLYAREGEPGGTIRFSHIENATGLGAGDGDYRVTVPAADVVAGSVEIPTLGDITWAAW